jgi:hypothetical protein
LCCEERNNTRLDPPAIETPLESPVGPGSGAQAHAFCICGDSRFLNSPMFQGPVMYMLKVPRSNSW